MYLPRGLFSHLYQSLVKRNHAAASPILLLVALEPDALCACRILTAMLKRDYIPHKIQPVSGFVDLYKAADDLVKPMRTYSGGSGGLVVCLGVGGMVDLEEMFGLDFNEEAGAKGTGDVEVWVMDARRPYNLTNIFDVPASEDPTTGELVREVPGVEKGRLPPFHRSTKGGVIVFDDGDIEEELGKEKEAYCGLIEMPEVGDEDEDEDEDDEEEEEHILREDAEQEPPVSGQKRKSLGGEDDDEDIEDGERPFQRRRSNSVWLR